MSNLIAAVVGFLALLSVAAAIVLGVYWLAWSAWVYVLPAVWPTGPELLIRPGFWLFVLGTWVFKFVFGGVFFARRSTT